MTECTSTVSDTSATGENMTGSADYIISVCRYAGTGLFNLLQGNGRQVREVEPESGTLFLPKLPIYDRHSTDRIIIWIPDEVYPLLQTLQVLVSVLNMNSSPQEVVVLSQLEPGWLWRSLQRLVPGRHRLSSVISLNSGLSCSELSRALQVPAYRPFVPLLSNLAQEEEKRTGFRMEGLTPRELASLLKLFDGSSVREQSSSERVSPKTLYSQRMSGLKKLTSQIPGLKSQLPGLQRTSSASSMRGFSPDEADFADGIHQGRVYPVFQPIVNSELKITGFEILTRWYRNGREWAPGEFLPLLHSRNIWMLLTAFVINVAVVRINQFAGRVYFAVNISPEMAESVALIRMAETARGQLANPAWVDCLVMEFSEDTNLTLDARPVATLRQLTEKGYRVFLDDCFSEGSVMFPMRQVRFSGYKLDMSMVNSLRDSKEDRNLISGMVYYCNLAGKVCIAEGVDTADKLAVLKGAGVEFFQGHLISRPVMAEELEKTVQRLGMANGPNRG